MSLGKGVIRDYDAVTGLATVEIVGGHAYYVQVPAATHLSAVQLVDGRRCAVLFFDDQNPRDGVIVAAYDAVAAGPNVHAAAHQVGGDDELDAADLGSGAADAGELLQADGSGGLAWVAPVGGVDGETASATDTVTTTSTSYVDVPNLSVTVTLAAADKVLLFFSATLANTTYGTYFRFYEGATPLGIEAHDRGLDGQSRTTNLHLLLDATAGEHTYKVCWKSDNAGTTHTLYGRLLTVANVSGLRGLQGEPGPEGEPGASPRRWWRW